MRNIEPGIYRHFKGRHYKVLGIATHTETNESLVVYQAMYENKNWYVRPLDMFASKVDREKYPEVSQEYRFELVMPEDVYNVLETLG